MFDLWAEYENFPRFMANVVEVRDLGSDLSHWTMKGPGGSTFEWDSILTEKDRPHTLAWRSVPGGEVEQRGEVYLEPFRGGTRATVRMSYVPPAGKAGQALARDRLLGVTTVRRFPAVERRRARRDRISGTRPVKPTWPAQRMTGAADRVRRAAPRR